LTIYPHASTAAATTATSKIQLKAIQLNNCMEIKTITVGAATHEMLRDYAKSKNISLAAAIKDLLAKNTAIPATGRAELAEQIQDLKDVGARAKTVLKTAMEEQDNGGIAETLRILEKNF
jgi:hypothetical protein